MNVDWIIEKKQFKDTINTIVFYIERQIEDESEVYKKKGVMRLPSVQKHLKALHEHLRDFVEVQNHLDDYYYYILDIVKEEYKNPRKRVVLFTVGHGYLNSGYKTYYVYAIEFRRDKKNNITIKPRVINTNGYPYHVLPSYLALRAGGRKN